MRNFFDSLLNLCSLGIKRICAGSEFQIMAPLKAKLPLKRLILANGTLKLGALWSVIVNDVQNKWLTFCKSWRKKDNNKKTNLLNIIPGRHFVLKGKTKQTIY